MADTGWLLPGVGGTYGSGEPWTNPQNITVWNNDTANTTDSKNSYSSQFLTATNFGFLVPENSVIKGVEVEIIGWGFPFDGGSPNQDTISLFEAGVPVGDNKADPSDEARWPSYSEDGDINNAANKKLFGSPVDTWGLPLTPAFIRSSEFGVGLKVSADAGYGLGIAVIRMKIYFEEPPTNTSVRDAGVWKPGEVMVRDGGIWKPGKAHVKDGGIWKS